MPLDRTSIGEAERGYRRGVVMGLTMAEIMLLLLFCMLLVSAGVLQDRDQKLKAAEATVRLTQDRLRQADSSSSPSSMAINDRLLAENNSFRKSIGTQPSATGAEISEDTWTELRLATDLIRSAKGRGVSLADVRAEIQSRNAGLDGAATPTPGEHDWPPIITLGNDQFRFQTNSAELTPDFRTRLRGGVVSQIRELLDLYGVDTVEVVGHTDESPINPSRPSTLDKLAIGALSGDVAVDNLVSVDNAGLGLARAIAVAKELGAAGLGAQGVKIIPLSAGQLVKRGDVISDGRDPAASKDRRRIEIRVRRSDQNG